MQRSEPLHIHNDAYIMYAKRELPDLVGSTPPPPILVLSSLGSVVAQRTTESETHSCSKLLAPSSGYYEPNNPGLSYLFIQPGGTT